MEVFLEVRTGDDTGHNTFVDRLVDLGKDQDGPNAGHEPLIIAKLCSRVSRFSTKDLEGCVRERHRD